MQTPTSENIQAMEGNFYRNVHKDYLMNIFMNKTLAVWWRLLDYRPALIEQKD